MAVIFNNKKCPKVSVVMSVYRESKDWLRKSIESIQNQSMFDFELIIVYDNPQNNEGLALLNQIAKVDERIIIICNEENIGLTKSLNKALSATRGEYIARMDADDVSLPNRLECQLEFLKAHPDIDICHTSFSIIDEKGKVIIKKYANKKNTDLRELFFRNFIAHPTIMFSRKLFNLRKPLYNEVYRSSQDYELWTSALGSGFSIGYLDEILLLYRTSKVQVTHSRQKEQKTNASTIRRNYIEMYLKGCGIDVDKAEHDPSHIMELINDYYPKASLLVRRNLNVILYLLYLSLSYDSVSSLLRFLRDGRMLKENYFSLKHLFRIFMAPTRLFFKPDNIY